MDIPQKKMHYMGHAEFKMPRNYIANDAYPMLEKAEVEKRILDSREKIAPTAATIRNGGKLKARHIFLFETIVTLPFNPLWSKYKLVAKDFHCEGNCIGCITTPQTNYFTCHPSAPEKEGHLSLSWSICNMVKEHPLPKF